MPVTIPAIVESALRQYRIPYLEQDVISANVIKNIQLTDTAFHLDIVLGFPAQSFKEHMMRELKNILSHVISQPIDMRISWQIQTHVVQPGIQVLPNVKNIIAVASGKGGVGKSTTAVNLALALSGEGARVGLLDADIYGPNQPHMLGVTREPDIENKQFVPITQHGIQSMSIGYLINANTPMIWRGPMVSTALQQLLRDTLWSELDYLLIDLPPGTGDIQLTLAQKVPVSGAVIVTTPQDIALLDARKGLEMFRKVKVYVLGVIENMSMHICSQCGHAEAIFGSGGGERMSTECETELLGQLPLDKSIREQADSGYPTVIAQPQSAIAQHYRDIACKLAARLSSQPRDYSGKFPKIVVENN